MTFCYPRNKHVFIKVEEKANLKYFQEGALTFSQSSALLSLCLFQLR